MIRSTTTAASGIAFLGVIAIGAMTASNTVSSARSFADERAGRNGTVERYDFTQMVQCMGDVPGLPLSACFMPGTPAETRAAVAQSMMDAWYASNSGDEGGVSYELGNRWVLGGSSSQGQPCTVRWSICPDGLSMPNEGLGGGTNNVNAKLTSTFGTLEAGKVVIRLIFQKWSDLTGLSYTELTDDGAAWGTSGSSARGDVRIGAHSFTDNDVLAYNFFPGSGVGGDMVINSGISWGSPANNWRWFRNILTHEHGHGIGLDHTCPENDSKLMEPFISVNFDGPQHDDIRGGQRHYGDAMENNDSAGTAIAFAGTGVIFTSNLSIDDNLDVDWYKFTGTAGMTATIKVTPSGFTNYVVGPETAQCNTGTNTNSLAVQNLQIQLYRSNGTLLLVTQNAQPAGIVEQITNYAITTNESYYVKVTPVSPAADNIQLYSLQLTLEPGILGDLNGDGQVDGADLGILLGNWGTNGVGDLNGDGTVDGADLGALLANWG